MFKLGILSLSAVVLVPAQAVANPIYIECKIHSTIDNKGEIYPTTGSDVFVVTQKEDGSRTYTLPPGCLDGTVKVVESSAEIEFSCVHAADHRFSYDMILNRVSGEYEKIYRNDSGGLMHLGTCHVAAPQF